MKYVNSRNDDVPTENNNKRKIEQDFQELNASYNKSKCFSETVSNHNIIGKSSVLLSALHHISIHGKYDAPVLITGETGTGKELAARGLHYGGSRSAHPFIAVNCATLTPELFASEIFGHKKGAFTDARQDKQGLLAAAESGSLFFDEVDSLSLNSQAALLRFLQEAEYRPVGSEKLFKANVRIIASANCDLETKIDAGLFRRDLYYRLYILTVHMPPLRERKGDVVLLCEHFLEKFEHQYSLGKKQLSSQLVKTFSSNFWAGNVRELENQIHRLYLLSNSEIVGNEHDLALELLHSTEATLNVVQNLAYEITGSHDIGKEDISGENSDLNYDFSRDKKNAIEEFESRYISILLERSQGNITRAAIMCGKERRAFGKLVKKYKSKS